MLGLCDRHCANCLSQEKKKTKLSVQSVDALWCLPLKYCHTVTARLCLFSDLLDGKSISCLNFCKCWQYVTNTSFRDLMHHVVTKLPRKTNTKQTSDEISDYVNVETYLGFHLHAEKHYSNNWNFMWTFNRDWCIRSPKLNSCKPNRADRKSVV